MYIVIFCSFLALLLTYLDSRHILKGGMKWGFILVTLLAVIHYDYGNDYMAYYGLYQQIESFSSLRDLISSDFYRDAGWSVINYLFKYLGGFFVLVAVISIFQGWAYYNLIKNNLDRRYWTFGVFIYVISTSLYLLNFSMLRQGFVVAVFVSLWPLIRDKKWIPALIILYLSSFIHGSALILIPFAFWGYMPVKNGKLFSVLFVMILVALYFSTRLVSSIYESVFSLTDTFQYYEDTYSEYDGAATFGLGFVIYMIPVFVSLWYMFKGEKEDIGKKSLVALSCIGTLITPLSASLQILSRVGIYFGAFRVAALPIAYYSLKNKTIRLGFMALYCLILLYDYYVFFSSEVFREKYSTFHTIFSHLF